MASPGFTTLEPLRPLMNACVHCGFCLPACPSYLLLGQEMDSPRGRIYMMRAGVEGRAALTPSMVEHFDTCLGCMACETSCPSGVKYAPLLEETRAAIEHHHRRPLGERLLRTALFLVLPYPARLRLLVAPLGVARWLQRRPRLLATLPARLRGLIALAPARPASRDGGPVPEQTPAAGPRRLKVGLVTGCVQSVFFQGVNHATVRVLSAEGCEVAAPAGQGCCGALALHVGRDDEARAFARDLIRTFEAGGFDQIVVNAAGCGSTLKTYGELLKDDPEFAARARAFAAAVRDVTETLASLGPPRAARTPLPLRVAYHDACHLAHAQGVRSEPRQLLASIPGVTLVPLAEPEICCGSAGVFNLLKPGMAADLGRRKARHIAAAAPDVVVTSNPGCILQIAAAGREAGGGPPVLHIVELLDRSLGGKSARVQ